jgi:hypothetical protein
MSDEDLLRKAAKAVGLVEPHSYREKTNSLLWLSESGFPSTWRPLDDDGEALRLSVELQFSVCIELDQTWIASHGHPTNPLCFEDHNGDPYAATRRAIVRAAASIGEKNGN